MFGLIAHGTWWGALFTMLLLVACVTDVRSRRIPNALVVVLLVAGVAFSLQAFPWPSGAIRGLQGVGAGFAIWIGFWFLGLLGAGDVKFFAAAGAWLGPSGAWRGALLSAVIGGVLAVFALLRDRRLRQAIERVALSVSSRSTRALGTTDDGDGSGRHHLPYGVALAGGAWLAAWFPNLLG